MNETQQLPARVKIGANDRLGFTLFVALTLHIIFILGVGFTRSAANQAESIPSMDIIQANRSLKRLIEENERLIQQNNALDTQFKNLKGQRSIELGRMKNLSAEKDQLQARIDTFEEVKSSVEDQLEDFKIIAGRREQELKIKVQSLSEKIEQIEEEPAVGKTVEVALDGMPKAVDPEQVSLEVITMIDEIARENARLKVDEAKVHYNMGNIFFKKGDYRKASKEFMKAVELQPHDYNAHFNLAFVHSEFLSDYKTALEHYKRYLDLNPAAEDVALVQEKIFIAEMTLRSQIDSRLEKDLQKANSFYTLRY